MFLINDLLNDKLFFPRLDFSFDKSNDFLSVSNNSDFSLTLISPPFIGGQTAPIIVNDFFV